MSRQIHFIMKTANISQFFNFFRETLWPLVFIKLAVEFTSCYFFCAFLVRSHDQYSFLFLSDSDIVIKFLFSLWLKFVINLQFYTRIICFTTLLFLTVKNSISRQLDSPLSARRNSHLRQSSILLIAIVIIYLFRKIQI